MQALFLDVKKSLLELRPRLEHLDSLVYINRFGEIARSRAKLLQR